jgi:hypothetical protein
MGKEILQVSPFKLTWSSPFYKFPELSEPDDVGLFGAQRAVPQPQRFSGFILYGNPFLFNFP